MKNFTRALVVLALFVTVLGSYAQVFVNFSIQNQQLLAGRWEFDVFMNVSDPGTYHSRGQLYITYNPVAFGNSVVNAGRVNYTTGPLLNELVFGTTNKYSTINLVDNTDNTFSITWLSNFTAFPPGATFHTLAPTTPTLLYHFSVQLANPPASKDIAFVQPLMTGQQFYLQAAGVEFPYGDGFLPVEWLGFTAEKLNNRDVLLKWATSAEANNKHFVVEKRREDGRYREIGTVAGAGTSLVRRDYEFLDQSEMALENTYRIRQVDIDGKTSYSNEVQITFDPLADAMFVVYPSPATDFTMLRANGLLDGDYRYTVLDAAGKTVLEGDMPRNTPAGEVKIDLNKLPSGIYYVRTVSAVGRAFTNQLVKISQ